MGLSPSPQCQKHLREFASATYGRVGIAGRSTAAPRHRGKEEGGLGCCNPFPNLSFFFFFGPSGTRGEKDGRHEKSGVTWQIM